MALETPGEAGVGLREEEADLYHADNMDLCYDRRFLYCHVLGPHLYHYHCDSSPNCLLQRSYRDCQYPQQREESPVYQVSQLVLLSDDYVFPLWRKRHLLLQTRPPGG